MNKHFIVVVFLICMANVANSYICLKLQMIQLRKEYESIKMLWDKKLSRIENNPKRK